MIPIPFSASAGAARAQLEQSKRVAYQRFRWAHVDAARRAGRPIIGYVLDEVRGQYLPVTGWQKTRIPEVSA